MNFHYKATGCVFHEFKILKVGSETKEFIMDVFFCDVLCCSCVSGYIGERCQFSDLEWLELQRAEKEKKRNVVIAACMALLISLLSITACVTYCYG